jgi:O-antigen/teichoic acid export membrane protein
MNRARHNRAGGLLSLGSVSAVYFLGTLLTRGIGFLLIPLFTHALTPAEYGVLAIASMATSLLTALMSLALESIIVQMPVRYPSIEKQQNLLGTLIVFWVVFAGLVACFLEVLGRAGYLAAFREVPFVPYLELAIWTSYFNVFCSAAQAVFVTREQPFYVTSLSAVASLTNIGISLLLVLEFHLGALGCLLGTFFSSATVGLVSIVLLLRRATICFRGKLLWDSLMFSLPLLPHNVALWGLGLSDRYLLARFVDNGRIGLYSLGCQIGLLVSLATNSVHNAFYPIVNAHLASPGTVNRVPRLGTFVIALFAFVCLGTSAFGPELIRLFTPLRYHEAAGVVPWIAVGFFFQGMYFVLSRGTWFSMRTQWMPVATGVAALVNVVSNLILIPSHGIIGAGMASVFGFGTLAILNGWLSTHTYAIRWDYARWCAIGAAGLACFFAGGLAKGWAMYAVFSWKLLMVCVVFPTILLECGVLEKEQFAQLCIAVRGKLFRAT